MMVVTCDVVVVTVWIYMGGAVIGEGHEGTFWGAENVLCLNAGIDNLGVYISENSLSTH
jgi:hypothetical protein